MIATFPLKIIVSIAGLAGSVYLFSQTQGWARIVSLFVGTSTTAGFWLRTRQDSLPITRENPFLNLLNPEKEYRFTWNINESENKHVFTGKARALDFGDRVVFIQTDEGTNGTYVMDLKRIEQSVTGVWWYVGGSTPQGTYRGKINPSGIIGTWQSPDGKQSGDWNFDLTSASESSLPEENG